MKCGMLFLCKSHVQGQTTCISSYFQSSTLNWLWPSLKNAALSWFRRSLYKNLDPGSEPDFPKLAQSVFMCEEPPALHMFELCCPEVLCNQFLCMAKYPPCNSHTDSGLLSFKRAGHAYMHWWRNSTAQSFKYSFPLDQISGSRKALYCWPCVQRSASKQLSMIKLHHSFFILFSSCTALSWHFRVWSFHGHGGSYPNRRRNAETQAFGRKSILILICISFPFGGLQKGKRKRKRKRKQNENKDCVNSKE